jgi:ferrous iron transport protein A
MLLSELPQGVPARVDAVQDTKDNDAISQRLRDLGFVPGETVRVVARGPWGGEPLAVKIGSTRFALRRSEAGRVIVDEALA